MKTLLTFIFFIFTMNIFSQKLPEYTYLYLGTSYNPFDTEKEIPISLVAGEKGGYDLRSRLSITIGLDINKNFSRTAGFGITIPVYVFINEEKYTNSNTVTKSDNDEFLGWQYNFGAGIGADLHFNLHPKSFIYIGAESNFINGTKFLRTRPTSMSSGETYAEENEFVIKPSAFIGARFLFFDISYNYLKGFTLKAGYTFNKTLF